MAFGLNIAIICFFFNFAITPSLLEIRGFQLNSNLLFFLLFQFLIFEHTYQIWFVWELRGSVLISASYSEVSKTSLVAGDFCKNLWWIEVAGYCRWKIYSGMVSISVSMSTGEIHSVPTECKRGHGTAFLESLGARREQKTVHKLIY